VEFSFDRQETQNNTNAIGSERLRKAIERNRAKQEKRAKVRTAPVAPPEPSPSLTTKRATRKSVVSLGQEAEFTTAVRRSTQKPPAPVSYRSSKLNKTPKSLTKSIASSKKLPKKSKLMNKTNELVMRGLWIFCAILLLRLIFSDGGVSDFYDKKQKLVNREEELSRIKKENDHLIKEIDLLKHNSVFQKKIVRDHLGYIAYDEFLILFPEEVQ